VLQNQPRGHAAKLVGLYEGVWLEEVLCKRDDPSLTLRDQPWLQFALQLAKPVRCRTETELASIRSINLEMMKILCIIF
jgi:hypothetical protein